MRSAHCVAGLGFGDEGKGTTVQWLVEKHSADLIVKYCGGCQAGHNVVDETDRRFTFSQIGATLRDDVPTYIWRNFIVDPLAMLNEADALKDFLGNGKDPLRNVYVHSDCLLIGEEDVQANRFSQTFLDHGTCGRGVGERRRKFREGDTESGWTAGQIRRLYDSYHHKSNKLHRVYEWATRVNVVEHPPDFRTAVFEGAQGILLDESVGFHPHTTWSTVRFDAAYACYRHLGITQHQNVGVIRTYHTRHGKGPFPTECDLGLTDPGNPTNEFQGPMRYGHFDRVLFNYALQNAGDVVHSFAVTHCDDGIFGKYCDAYDFDDGSVVSELPRPACIEDQVEICKLIQRARPRLWDGRGVTQSALYGPILFVSFGPKLSDKEEVR